MFCSSGRWSVSSVTFSNVSCVVPCSRTVIRRSVTVRLFEIVKTGSGELGLLASLIATPWMASVRRRTCVLKAFIISLLGSVI